MAYSQLIKNFERIRNYMKQFYIYGFKTRDEYDAKSGRSYDDERRRIESYLGDYMAFRQTREGKTVFISIDSRSARGNPLYNAFRAKSFTDGDITLHFILLDILCDPQARFTAGEIVDAIDGRYLNRFGGTAYDWVAKAILPSSITISQARWTAKSCTKSFYPFAKSVCSNLHTSRRVRTRARRLRLRP